MLLKTSTLLLKNIQLFIVLVLCGHGKLGLSEELTLSPLLNKSNQYYSDFEYSLTLKNNTLFLQKMMITKVYEFPPHKKIDLYSHTLSNCHVLSTQNFYDEPVLLKNKKSYYSYCIDGSINLFYEGFEKFLGYKDLNKVQIGSFLFDLKSEKKEKASSENICFSSLGTLFIQKEPNLRVSGKNIFYEDTTKKVDEVFCYKQYLLLIEPEIITAIDLIKKTTRNLVFKSMQIYDLGFVALENNLGLYKLEGLE